MNKVYQAIAALIVLAFYIILLGCGGAISGGEWTANHCALNTGIKLALGYGPEIDDIIKRDKHLWPAYDSVLNSFYYYKPDNVDLWQDSTPTKAEAQEQLDLGNRIGICYQNGSKESQRHCKPVRVIKDWDDRADWMGVAYTVE